MFPLQTNILVVDDMMLARDFIAKELLRLGYNNIHFATDGDEAIGKLVHLKNQNIEIGLIISDWNMPNLSGLDFLKRVRSTEEWKTMPFIIVTTESEKDRVMEAVVAGVSQYIVKPIAPFAIEQKMFAVWKKLNPG